MASLVIAHPNAQAKCSAQEHTIVRSTARTVMTIPRGESQLRVPKSASDRAAGSRCSTTPLLTCACQLSLTAPTMDATCPVRTDCFRQHSLLVQKFFRSFFCYGRKNQERLLFKTSKYRGRGWSIRTRTTVRELVLRTKLPVLGLPLCKRPRTRTEPAFASLALSNSLTMLRTAD